MSPPGHAVISAGVGAVVWAFTRSVSAAVTALAVGVLMDVDHLVDYYFWLWKERTTHLWLVLHWYELAIPMFLATWLSGWHPMLLAATLAYLAHMLTDQFTNRLEPFTYFMTYRATRGFALRELVKFKEERELYRELLEFPGVGPVLYRLHPKFRKLKAGK